MGWKKGLYWAMVLFVWKVRVGKSSMLRILYRQSLEAQDVTSDGTDICVVETSDWVRLEQQQLFPSRFDQIVASTVGNALVASQQHQSKVWIKWSRLTKVLAVCLVLTAGSVGYLELKPISAPTPPAPMPIAVPTPAATHQQSYGSYATTPAPTPRPPRTTAPTPSPKPPPTPAPAPALDLPVLSVLTAVEWSAAGLFAIVLACLLISRRSRAAATAKLAGLLSAEPTEDVLQKMPVDLIVEVMQGGNQEHITFSAWDFAGQDIYYSVHSPFITSGVYVVVFSMQEAQHDMPKCLEYLSFWMNSVHSHTSDVSDYHLLIVGTHGDVVHQPADHQVISLDIESTFKDCGFWSRVEQPSEHNSHLCFFPIDNTSSREQDGNRVMLHAAINTLGQHLVDSKNHEYPLRWLKVLDELHRQAEGETSFVYTDHPQQRAPNMHGSVFANSPGVSDLYTIARQFGVGLSAAEYSTLCTFLAEVGSFLLFQNILIIRPQWIADILFAVITRPQFQALTVAADADSQSEWLRFEASAVISERLLVLLWSRFDEPPEFLINVMIHYDLMFEFSSQGSIGRQFLVPAMLPDTKDLVQDVETGDILRLNGLATELEKIGACFEGVFLPPRAGSSTKSLSDWPVADRKPACYLVFEQVSKVLPPSAIANRQTAAVSIATGFIPEGFWFTLLVKCARWAQQTDSKWSQQHLAQSFRRDVARFSFGAQQFELRLHRAQHAIRLVVLGDSINYPAGVLQRVRSLVDGTLADHFPALQYFVALRIETEESTSLVDLATAISQVERRDFRTMDSFTSSIAVDSSASSSSVVAVGSRDVAFMTCRPWCPPPDPDTEFDVYLSHVDADQELACKVYDCFAKCSSASGNRVRVFLRNVSYAHTSRQITAEVALHRSTVFVPVISIKSISVCGGMGNEHIALLAASRWEAAVEKFAILLTVVTFAINLVHVLYRGSVHHSDDTLHHRYRFWYLASVVAPRSCNAIFIARIIQTEQRDQPRFVVWLHQNLQALSVVVLLACLRLDNFALLQSTGVGRRFFSSPPPMSTAAISRSTAFGVISTLLGDCPQLVISMVFLPRGDAWGFADAINLSQVIVSTTSLLHQLILRSFAFMLVSAPHVEQQWLDQITETGQLLDCMIAEDLHHRQSATSRRDRSKLAAVLPLVVDPKCLDVHFSTEQVPVKVMEQYTEVMGAAQFARRIEPPRIGALLSRLTQSADVINMSNPAINGGLPVGSSDQCDFAARAVAQFLDRLEESTSAGGGDADDDGGEFRRRRRDRSRAGLGSELPEM
jgi:GTPase SAR1 family protein